MNIRKPYYKIEYEGTDITADVEQYLIKLQYDDIVDSESDDLSIVLEDSGDLWKNSWYPETGAKVTVDFGYEDLMVPAGTFDIDELESSGPPDEFTLRALATGIGEAMRTKRSRAHEGKTLGQIADTIASENGLELDANIDDVEIQRVTQNRQTDLAFLKELSQEYGYYFSVRDRVMTFVNQIKIEQADPAELIDRTDLISWFLTDKTTDVYQESELKFTNPKLKEVIRGLQREGFDVGRTDKLELRGSADNVGQAERKAAVALHRANSMKTSGLVTIQGNPSLVAGVNITLTGLGVISGVYHIKKSSHSIEREGGYQTTLDIKRVSEIDVELHTPQKIDIPVR